MIQYTVLGQPTQAIFNTYSSLETSLTTEESLLTTDFILETTVVQFAEKEGEKMVSRTR